MVNSQLPEITEVMRREFGLAKRYWNLALVTQFGMLALGWLAQFQLGAYWVWGSVGLIAAFLAVVLRFAADSYYERGERTRRLAFWQDSVGRVANTNELLLTLALKPRAKPAEPAPIGAYFGSSAERGVRRLLDNLHESAFYTHRVAVCARNAYSAVCVLGLLSAVILLRATVEEAIRHPGADGRGLVFLGRLATEVIGFFAAGSFLELALSYHQLARSAERTFERCGLLRDQGSVDEAILSREVSDYDCALGKARPLPTWAYRLQRQRLEEAWRKVAGSNTD